jgi:lipoate-protein ligase A
LDACRALGVPVLRRISGGGTVVQGPGCLNYTLVVPTTDDPAWGGITTTNRKVMEVHARVVRRLLGREVRREGDTDLAVDGVKFSGNAQRRKLRSLVFHGTFLLDFDLALIERLLPMPSRQPGYRQERAHGAFVANVPLGRAALKTALTEAWGASDPLQDWPEGLTQQLVREKYSRDEWNLKC